MTNEMLLAEILTQTVANVYSSPNESYFKTLQKTITNLEKHNKIKAKYLLSSLIENIKWN